MALSRWLDAGAPTEPTSARAAGEAAATPKKSKRRKPRESRSLGD